MDRDTLSNYGWIVIITLVLSVMLAFTTPFGEFVGRGSGRILQAIRTLTKNNVNEDKYSSLSNDFENKLNQDLPSSSSSAVDKHNTKIVYGATYKTADGQIYNNKQDFPQLQNGDQYIFEDYKYTFNNEIGGWKVDVLSRKLNTYGKILSEINSIPIVSLDRTFESCTNLTKLSDDFTIPQTVNSTNWMFNQCKSLVFLPENFELPSNADIAGTFRGCSSLTKLPNGFTIPHGAKSLSQLFYDCQKLEYLPTGFSLPDSVDNVTEMFYNCYKLSAIPTSLKIPYGVNSTDRMFSSCKALTMIPGTFIIPDSVQVLTYMFDGSGISEIPDTFKIPQYATNINSMFKGTKITAIPSTFKIPSTVKQADSLFANCEKLTTIPATFKIPGTVKDASSMFSYSGVTSIPVNLISSGVENIDLMFTGTPMNNISNFAIPNTVQSAQKLFSNCKSLIIVPGTFKIPGSVKDASKMFYNCIALTTIENGFEIGSGVENIANMFEGTAIKTTPASFTLPSSIQDLDFLFSNCSKLISLHNNFTLEGIAANECNGIFRDCTRLKSIPDGFKVDNRCKSIYRMFYNCASLERIPVDFTISENIRNTKQAFFGCKSLNAKITINANKGLTGCDQMFNGTIAPIVVKGDSPYIDEMIATATKQNVIKYTDPVSNKITIRIFLGTSIAPYTTTYKKTSDLYLGNSSSQKIELTTTGTSITIPNGNTVYQLSKDMDHEYRYWMLNGKKINDTMSVDELIQLNGGDKMIILYPYFEQTWF